MFRKRIASRRGDAEAALLLAVLLIAACGSDEAAGGSSAETRGAETGPAEAAADARFSADVSGAVAGRVAGPGIVQFIPPAVAGSRSEDGYFFIADDAGVRDLGITFTIPAGTEPGPHELMTGSPLEVGEHFEVRVDHSVGNRTDSFARNTRGTLVLDAFPGEGSDVAGNRVAGSFEFVTEDSQGRQVSASGRFDFEGR